MSALRLVIRAAQILSIVYFSHHSFAEPCLYSNLDLSKGREVEESYHAHYSWCFKLEEDELSSFDIYSPEWDNSEITHLSPKLT